MLSRPGHAINHRQSHHSQHNRHRRKKEIPPALQHRMFSDFSTIHRRSGFPRIPSIAAPSSGAMVTSKKHQPAHLAVQNPSGSFVPVNTVNSLHDQLHYLRARQQRPSPAQRRDLPRVRAALHQELRNDGLAPRRQEPRQIRNEVKQTGFAPDPARRHATATSNAGKMPGTNCTQSPAKSCCSAGTLAQTSIYPPQNVRR